MIYILGYIFIAVIAYGLIFNYWQTAYPLNAKNVYYQDMIFSLAFAIFWPICIILLIRDSFLTGTKLRLKFK